MYNIVSIIVTYNGEKWIKKCLDSLLASSILTDIYIIDNNSTDNTLNIIKSYPNVSVIKSDCNLGFGKANNFLLKKLYKEKKYSYYFLINQDAWVDKSCLQLLVEFSVKNPTYGIVSPIHYTNNFSVIDFNFKEYLAKSREISDEIYETDFVNAAFWLISKDCIEKVGLFNPYFIHYGEDKNYCNRVVYYGKKIGILKNAKANHDRQKTTDFKKIQKLSMIKLDSIFLNPNNNLWKAYARALINVWGIPKYYSKTLSIKNSILLFNTLIGHYIKLLFSEKIRVNRKEQIENVFSIN
ncbi:glycosyltransferase [Apibacter sp.]|uniref:glycosyltransferase n=1 Tax=Apibacter sp. TaxID=2023709 RepID=UPI0025E71363|nr:glycosyltransferase [Apibacter sp.]MCT6869419.1 glycosyltransferase [Apibacter sp.]